MNWSRNMGCSYTRASERNPNPQTKAKNSNGDLWSSLMEKKRICWKIFRKALQNAQQKSSSQKPSDQRIAGSCCEILPTSLAKWFSRVVTLASCWRPDPRIQNLKPIWRLAVGDWRLLDCWVVGLVVVSQNQGYSLHGWQNRFRFLQLQTMILRYPLPATAAATTTEIQSATSTIGVPCLSFSYYDFAHQNL